MKRILFIMPLMAISLLASCGGDNTTTYNVTIGESSHLSFTALDGSSLDNIHPKKNEEFKFKMKTIDEGEDTYRVPSVLNISVEGGGELIEGYTIDSKSEKEAEITIEASKVIGNITISGQAVFVNEYRYEFKANYGVEPIESKVVSKNEDLIIELKTIKKDDSEEKYLLPEAENIYIQFDNCATGDKVQWVSPVEELKTYCKYEKNEVTNTGILTIKPDNIKSNIIIVVRAKDYPLLEKISWEDIHKVSFSGIAEYIFYLGEEKSVIINNQPHQVHIIGFDQDYTDLDDINSAIGITFEFKNTICDENGYSLATYWQDTSDMIHSSNSYKNSSVRKALIGEGNADLNWFRYYGKNEDTESTGKNRHFVPSDDPYYQKSVYDMLPKALTEVLMTPSKYINIYNSETSKWEEKTIEDKLFLLSPFETGKINHDNEEEYTVTYSYYERNEDIKRIKHQVKGEKDARVEPVKGTDLSGSAFGVTKKSYAGYDSEDKEGAEGGSCVWLRSPRADNKDTRYVFSIDRLGRYNIYTEYLPCREAINIAPAFCI